MSIRITISPGTFPQLIVDPQQATVPWLDDTTLEFKAIDGTVFEDDGIVFDRLEAPYSRIPGGTDPLHKIEFTAVNDDVAKTGILWHYTVHATEGWVSTAADPTVENEPPPPVD
jgi:hypothetical protein